MRFNFLGVDEKGPLGGGGLDGGEQNNVEMMEDLSIFELLGTAESRVGETQEKRLMRWCKALSKVVGGMGRRYGMASEKLCGESARECADGSQNCYDQLPVVTPRLLCF